MPAPVTPNSIKELIPAASGSLCEKFLNLFKFPKLMHLLVSYWIKEDGSIGTEFAADICALNCGTGGSGSTDGTGGGPAGVLQPPANVEATDGNHTDKVVVTWNSVVGATYYDVYRSTSDSSATATKVRSDETGTSFEDDTVAVSTYYWYWVKARNAAQTSAFSASNRGNAGSMTQSLPAVTDLVATKGLFPRVGTGGEVRLTFSKVTGANKYSIYRNTTNDFSTASLLSGDREPYVYGNTNYPGTSPFFVDNGTDLVYVDTIPQASRTGKFYYWVIAKRTQGTPAESTESNNGAGAEGFAAYGDGRTGSSVGAFEIGQEYTIPAGTASVWMAVYNAGGGGAGGNGSYGGGGGGGGSCIAGKLAVAVGGKIRLVCDPTSPGARAGTAANGAAGPSLTAEYSANGAWSDTAVLFTLTPAGGGVFNPAGGGAGGAGGGVSGIGSITDYTAYNGKAGEAAVGINGGRGGHRQGMTRGPMAHHNGFSLGSWAGDSQVSGGGGSKGGAVPELCTGGVSNFPGSAIVYNPAL